MPSVNVAPGLKVVKDKWEYPLQSWAAARWCTPAHGASVVDILSEEFPSAAKASDLVTVVQLDADSP